MPNIIAIHLRDVNRGDMVRKTADRNDAKTAMLPECPDNRPMTIATFDDFAAEAAPQTQVPATAHDGLASVLKRKGDRLLNDVGLSRSETMSSYDIFLRETRAQHALWNL